MEFVRDALHVDLRQAARRLATHEDARFVHAHKALGAVALAHFGYRLARWALYGSVGIDGAPMSFAVFILLHAALHVSSFEFSVPPRRNGTYNIIWPEMRWHSLIFAYRSLAVLALVWLERRGIVPASADMPLRALVVFGAMAAADLVTLRMGDGSTTMRGNPYPSYTPRWVARSHNLFYSVSQFFATAEMLLCGPNIVFLSLIPIQTAPFGMTLEKKGVITQAGWHLWYTSALLVSYLHGIYGPPTCVERSVLPTVVLVAVARTVFRVNKYAVWSVVVAFHVAGRLLGGI